MNTLNGDSHGFRLFGLGYATVYAAKFKSTGEDCAVKAIELNRALDHDGRDSHNTFGRLTDELDVILIFTFEEKNVCESIISPLFCFSAYRC